MGWANLFHHNTLFCFDVWWTFPSVRGDLSDPSNFNRVGFHVWSDFFGICRLMYPTQVAGNFGFTWMDFEVAGLTQIHTIANMCPYTFGAVRWCPERDDWCGQNSWSTLRHNLRRLHGIPICQMVHNQRLASSWLQSLPISNVSCWQHSASGDAGDGVGRTSSHPQVFLCHCRTEGAWQLFCLRQIDKLTEARSTTKIWMPP